MTHFKSADNKHSVQWLAERINCNRRNIYDIFQRPSIDTELLMRISKALDHDFFADISRLVKEEESSQPGCCE